MSDKFNEEQNYALELFKQRLFLEQIIDETTSFNKRLNFDEAQTNLFLTTTAESIVDVFKLRSEVYASIGYSDEFPDTIDGLNFDMYDFNSAIVYYKKDGQITATTRLIFDSHRQLPSEDKFSFDSFRAKFNTIGEVSRLMIKNERQGSGQEFKYLTRGIYKIYENNNIDLLMSGIKKEHYKLYSKFGGFEIENELTSYGALEQTSLILSWNPSQISKFFKKAFLR
jgi:predicted GNAT family N-acyltransferase